MGSPKSEREKQRDRKFGVHMQTLRMEQNEKSAQSVCERAGLDRSFYSNVENGRRSATISRLPDFAIGLNVDLVDLVECFNDEVGEPKHLRLARRLQGNIADGTWKHGDVLPTEPELCKEYETSRFAVRRALTILRGHGLVRTVGSMTYVSSSSDLTPISVTEGDRVAARMPTPEEAAEHGIPDGVPILTRVRDNDLETIYPADRFSIHPTTTQEEID